jgi:CheY-like chemotaxis protein
MIIKLILGVDMKKRILWVEDEDDQFRAFSYKLTKEYDITRSIDYAKAVELFQTNNYDLIIVDIILASGFPQETINSNNKIIDTYYGIEFIKQVRSINKDVPIIVVSIVTEGEKIIRIRNIDDRIEFIYKYDSTSEDVKRITDIIFKQNNI